MAFSCLTLAVAVHMGLWSLHMAREAGLGRAGIHPVQEGHSRLGVGSIGPGSSLELLQVAAVEDSPAAGSLAAGDSLAVGRSRAVAVGSLALERANHTGYWEGIGCIDYRDSTFCRCRVVMLRC